MADSLPFSAMEPVVHVVLSFSPHLRAYLSPSTISLCIDGPRRSGPVRSRTRTSRGGVNREVQLLVCRSAL